ncbi:MAG: sensor histidine kinase, partial [Pseudobdellovibrionaceae bacterium]
GLRFEEIHPLQVSDLIVNELAVLAQEKNIMIQVSGDVPPFLADLRSVEQVLRNLVSNAIKYIPHSSEVKILWKEDHEEITLHVIDGGSGIAKEHLPRLFERFYRIDRGRSRDQGGTGLGLAIVKHIMQSHGGSVTVKSEIGKGAEFICHFPKNRKKDRLQEKRI